MHRQGADRSVGYTSSLSLCLDVPSTVPCLSRETCPSLVGWGTSTSMGELLRGAWDDRRLHDSSLDLPYELSEACVL